MKVLFLCHPELDIGEYCLFNGLCELLGDENVVTFPYKKIYNGQIADDYVLDDGKKGYTPPYDYMLKRNQKPQTIEEIVKNINIFDLVILASARTYAVNALREIRSKVKFSQPLVFHESEDYEDIRFDIINEFRPTVFFKRTIRKDGKNQFFENIKYNLPIYPFPLSAIVNTAPKVDDGDKKYSVWHVQGNTFELRERIHKLLLDMNLKNSFLHFVDSFAKNSSNALSYRDFMSTIAQSQIAVCSRGWSDDMQKRMEIPVYETLMFTHVRGYIEPNEFENQKHCIFYKLDLSDLVEKIGYYLQDENETRRIAKEGKNFLYKYHTSTVRAKEFIDITMRYA